MTGKKLKGYGSARNPLISLVPRDRIELPTRGFSDTAFKFPTFQENHQLIVNTMKQLSWLCQIFSDFYCLFQKNPTQNPTQNPFACLNLLQAGGFTITRHTQESI